MSGSGPKHFGRSTMKVLFAVLRAATRKLGYAMAVGLTLVAAGPIASSPTPLAFDFRACGANATDIVVTDPDGVVLECWRGELRPGDTVRLGPARLTPANALPWDGLRLRPDRALSGAYRDYTSLLTLRGSHYDPPLTKDHEYKLPRIELWPMSEKSRSELRLVLFIRKEGPTGAGVIWAPVNAPSNGIAIGYRFGGTGSMKRIQKYGLTTSVAWIEAGRVLALQASDDWIYCRDGSVLLTPIAHDVKCFKSEVLALPASPRPPVADIIKDREFTPSSQTTLAGWSSRLWTAPNK